MYNYILVQKKNKLKIHISMYSKDQFILLIQLHILYFLLDICVYYILLYIFLNIKNHNKIRCVIYNIGTYILFVLSSCHESFGGGAYGNSNDDYEGNLFDHSGDFLITMRVIDFEHSNDQPDNMRAMGHTMGTNLRGINAITRMIKALWTIIIVRIIEVCQIIILLIPIT